MYYYFQAYKIVNWQVYTLCSAHHGSTASSVLFCTVHLSWLLHPREPRWAVGLLWLVRYDKRDIVSVMGKNWPSNFHFLPFGILVLGTHSPYWEKPKSHGEASVGTGNNSSPPTAMRMYQPSHLCAYNYDQHQAGIWAQSTHGPWEVIILLVSKDCHH